MTRLASGRHEGRSPFPAKTFPTKRAIAGLASGIDEGRSLFPAKTFVTKMAIGPTLSLGD